MTNYVNQQYLVETDWLQEHLDDPDLRIIDSTVRLVPVPEKTFKVQSELATWEAGHIPGSMYLNLQEQLSDNDSRLRFTFPSSQKFAAEISAQGIGNDNRVIIYSTASYIWATRLWFMFRTFGFDNVAILNGGFPKWLAEDRPVSTEPCHYPAAEFTAVLNTEKIATKSHVSEAINRPDTCTLNALGRAQFSGEGAHYGRPGRIKGSESAPAAELINSEDNTILGADELTEILSQTGALSSEKIIAYCGGGIAATGTLFALALLGHEDNAALYDASLSEWANDPEAPMEVG